MILNIVVIVFIPFTHLSRPSLDVGKKTILICPGKKFPNERNKSTRRYQIKPNAGNSAHPEFDAHENS